MSATVPAERTSTASPWPTSHAAITQSSGTCALVVGIAFAGAALCGARRGVRVAVGLLTLAALVVLVSPEPSVVRAAVMAAIAMLGVVLGRTGAGVSLLSTAVVGILVLDPWQAGSLGFALSVAATAALLLGAGPLADGLARWMPAPLALALSVPLSAQLACGPLLVLIAPQVPVYGVVANLLAAPAAPVGTVVGLLTGRRLGVMAVREGPEHFAPVAEAVAAGAVTVEIDRVFPLAQVAEALAFHGEGRALGKVVVRVAG